MIIKNKVYYVLFVLMMCFSFITNVYADELDFSFTASANKTEVISGNETEINVSLKSNDSIVGCLISIEADSTLEFVSKTGINGWSISQEGDNGILIESNSMSVSLANGVNILNLKYKVNGNGSVRIKPTTCVSSDEKSKDYSENHVVELKVQDLSDVTTLSNITVTNGIVTNFYPKDFTPLIKLNKTNFGLSFTATNPDYQDDIVVTDIDGKTIDNLANINFDDPSDQGVMTLYVTVNNVTKYELGIVYENETLDNSLSTLIVGGKKVNLVKSVLEYTVTLGKDISNFEVQASLADSTNFQFAGGNGPGTFSIVGNSTTLALIVEPKNSSSGGTSVTYLIEVVKEGVTPQQSSSSNNNANTNSNPQTGNISMFIMAIILLSSLIGSVFLYQKNIEGYK